MTMLLITFAYAAVMIVLGLLVFAAAPKSVTALIPSFIGIVVATLAAVASHPPIRKHMIHAIVLLALIVTLVGLGMGFGQLGQDQISVPKVVDMLGMGLVSGVYLVFAIRSFIAARRSRQEGGQAQTG